MQTPLFARIDAEAIEKLWALGRSISYEAGQGLFDRGSEGRDFLVIESGSIDLFFPITILGAAKDVVVEHLGPRDAVAWSALVAPYTLTLSGRCTEPCRVRVFPREILLKYLQEHPDVGYVFAQNLAGVIARRLHDFQNLWISEVRSKMIGLLE
jgi:CRP-like cAMP-binding protein